MKKKKKWLTCSFWLELATLCLEFTDLSSPGYTLGSAHEASTEWSVEREKIRDETNVTRIVRRDDREEGKETIKHCSWKQRTAFLSETPVCGFVDWLVGLILHWFVVGWSVVYWIVWLLVGLVGCMLGWIVCCLIDWQVSKFCLLFVCLVSRFASRLEDWSVSLLISRLAHE